MRNKIYGWKPDLPDHRDLVYKVEVPIDLSKLPQTIDLSSKCSPVEDQGSLGSCTANAIVGCMEYLENINITSASSNFINLSRLFIYYNERLLEGTTKTDSGALIRDGIKSLAKAGVCAESLWPYTISKFANKPSKICYKDALKKTISNYSRLNNLSDMLQCLASGYPFTFGFSVYEYFESQEMATTGILKMPNQTERLLGGHAICCVGYDLTKKMLLIRNSWGANWGINGYFWMPFDYVTNRNLSDDFWTIRK
jgi:C1A family cysteine protease